MRRVQFLTRPQCGLCADSLPKVELACRWLRRQLVVTDITTDPGLQGQYHLRIPVVLDGDDEVLAEGALTQWDALRAVWRA